MYTPAHDDKITVFLDEFTIGTLISTLVDKIRSQESRIEILTSINVQSCDDIRSMIDESATEDSNG